MEREGAWSLPRRRHRYVVSAKSGVHGYEFYTWTGLMAPARTPPAIVQRLFAITVKALSSGDVRDQFAAQGVEASPSRSPDVFAEFIANEQRKMRALATIAGLKPE
jgi:tripartite-type tricarboxylate transporter receptor subunit TctC